MKKIAIVNNKGGVGKTTSTANLGACLSQKGYRVLLIDIDPQGNLSKLFKSYNTDNLSVADVLLDENLDIHSVIRKTDFENLDILPANINLTSTEKLILIDENRSQQDRLDKVLLKVNEEYDYCLLDCPPSLNIITLNALCTSDDVFVPIKIDKFALDGLQHLLETIEDIKEKYNSKLNFKGCFVTMDSATTVNKLIKQELKNSLEDKLFNTTIKQNIKVTESTFYECPVVFSHKKARASINYKDLCNEVF